MNGQTTFPAGDLWRLARYVAGDYSSIQDAGVFHDARAQTVGAALLAANGEGPLHALESALTPWPDGAAIFDAIFAIDPAGPDPEEKPPGRRLDWSADDLLAAEFSDPPWAIPNLLPVGLTILAGRPKLGKSWLALQIGLAVAAGGVVLGERVQAGTILYFALEDSERRLQGRMQKQGWPRGLAATFVFRLPPLVGATSGERGLDVLEKRIRGVRPRLAVIDTLSRAVAGGADQNDVGAMTPLLGHLQQLALEVDCSLVLIDHLKKGFSGDQIDDVLGSTGKAAVADSIWALYRERGKSGAVLKATGRDFDQRDLAVEWDGPTYSWRLLGNAEEVNRANNLKRILRAFTDLGRTATTKQVAEHLFMDRGNVSRLIGDLVSAGNLRACPRQGKEVPYELL